MKQTKRRIEPFAFFNFEGIAAHLKNMAQKGWMIDNINNFGWGYRRIEPKKVHFAVSYFPKASEFDPEPTEEQQRFIDFCAHTGWELACTSAQMQIFYNERENPTPIETEPELELESIHASAKKSFLPSYLLFMLVGLLQGVMWISTLLGDPIDLLVNSTKLMTGFCWFLLLLLTVVELICYSRWRRKALRTAQQGAFLAPPNTAKFQKCILIAAVVMLVYWLVSWLICGDALKRWIAVAMCIYMPVLFTVTNGVKAALKRMKASRGMNRTLTLLASIACAFVIMGGITAGTLYASSRGYFDAGEIGTYEHNGMTFSIRDDELPLTVEDLMDVDYDSYIKERRGDQSILLSQYVMRQHPRFDAERYSEMPQLDYTIVGVRLPFLYEMCKARMISEEEERYSDHSFNIICEYRTEDAATWNAGEAYRLHSSEFGFRNQYLLCYDRLIVKIEFDWEPTAEQKKIIGEIFGGR